MVHCPKCKRDVYSLIENMCYECHEYYADLKDDMEKRENDRRKKTS